MLLLMINEQNVFKQHELKVPCYDLQLNKIE